MTKIPDADKIGRSSDVQFLISLILQCVQIKDIERHTLTKKY